MSDNPYAPPASVVETRGMRLWTPNAAANWSVMFSAVFGSTLVYLNYKELGEQERSEVAAAWVLACIGGLLLTPTVALAPLIVLLTWYFGSAKKHARWVRQRYGGDYERRPWGKPIVLGVLGGFGFGLLLFVLELNDYTRGASLAGGIGCIAAALGITWRAKRRAAAGRRRANAPNAS